MKKGILNLFIFIFFPSLFISFFTSDIYSKQYIFYLFIAYLLLSIYLIIIYRKELKEYIVNFRIKDINKFIIIFIIGFGLIILSNYIINYLIIPNGISNNEQSNRDILLNNKYIYSIMLCTLIPFVEEITFRLGFNSIKNKYLYVIVSSLIFASLHILSTTSLIELLYIIPYFILGLTLSTIMIKTKNIFYSIFGHILNNIISIIVILLF